MNKDDKLENKSKKKIDFDLLFPILFGILAVLIMAIGAFFMK